MDYRASFDATVAFTNGGGLTAEGFRIDIPGPDTPDDEIARLFVESLGLLMAGAVELRHVERFPEQHKGTRGGPADLPGAEPAASRLVELSHVIRAGMVTYPGLPEPVIRPHLTRAASREHYAQGTEFAIDVIEMCGNTGTYMDAPFHRYADGGDLTSISLDQTVDLPAVVLRAADGALGIDAHALAALDVEGKAVLLHTGDAVRFGTPEYGSDAHFLTEDGARALVDRGASLVGIDAINIDQVTPQGTRPAHTLLLAARIPLVEHLTNLESVPATGARFTAVPLRIAGLGTVSVRAFARV
jgi:arylformamidase